jgi:hypothetical protein
MYKCTLKIHFDWDCSSSIDQVRYENNILRIGKSSLKALGSFEMKLFHLNLSEVALIML